MGDPSVSLTLVEPRNADMSFGYGAEPYSGCISLSPDYFTETPSPRSFHVPMAMHPHFYEGGMWDAPIQPKGKRSGMFFAGDFDKSKYSKRMMQDSFGCLTRLQMAEVTRERFPEKNNLVRTKEELESCCGANRIIYADRADFAIPMERWRETLAAFDFFLAHPGTDMPLCHNIVEALSVGCIPILQSGYARVLHAGLKSGVNCLIFRDADDLCAKVREAFDWPAARIQTVQKNVNELYYSVFTPEAVVKELLRRRPHLDVAYVLSRSV